ncbi:glycine--tRNA ligase subunit beta, partial [Sphingomonas sp. Leaf412]|uniref:glycine--tRNA ligase subunit beta n=1 Tax=Sphingomonas sp. Leaf412 TaxID=1736370 RepID=UPI0009E95BA0
MTDFLLELRSEEIPARMQGKAREDLARLFAAELAKAGLAATATTTYATPRRLALILRGLPDATQAVAEETKGPKAGAPPQALDGFLRKTGLTREQLVERDGVLFAVVEKPGRATADVLADAIPAVIRAFPWPKSMRWGAASASTESLRWVRPLQGIVALFGKDVVPVEIAGLTSGAATVGHRFHHPGAIMIGGADDYVGKLRDAHVIVDQDERRSIIALGATMAAKKAGLTLVRDEGLLIENAGLTEWPMPLLGRFDPAFLDVPPEVIQLTARVNQKYFVCQDADGKLANAFVCTANIDAADGGERIVEGNRKVLAARLSDARFFYEQDLKVPLAEQAEKLKKIVFHEKLGTVADKVDRVAKLARWLVEEGIILPGTGRGTSEAGGGGAPRSEPPVENPLHRPSDGPPQQVDHAPHDRGSSGGRSDLLRHAGEDTEELASLADRAARLCKADLVTGMVGEFPELQGLMGGYYAAAQGEDPRVAAAIRDHYKPVGAGDDVPTDPVTVAVSLADKLDTVVGFFVVDERPSGSRDPFALRRAALGIISLVEDNGIRLRISQAVAQLLISTGLLTRVISLEPAVRRFEADQQTLKLFGEVLTQERSDQYFSEVYPALDNGVLSKILDRGALIKIFLADRLKVQQREAGVRHDLIDAVFALGGEDDLVRLLARVRALQAFVATPDGANLLAGYKRAANILKKEGSEAPSPHRGEGRGPLASASGKGEGTPQATPPVA